MGIKGAARAVLTRLVARYGYELIAAELLYDWQRSGFGEGADEYVLPEELRESLRPDHSRLEELTTAYERFDRTVTEPSVWRAGFVSDATIRQFRADSPYVWQTRGVGELNYLLTAYYAQSVDSMNLLGRLEEDGAFGAYVVELGGRTLSRDLLDSVLEINFLERHLHLSSRPDLSVIDIGAGYGRLAHRMTAALPNIASYYCVDAVPVSTFLSEFYVRYRAIGDRATVVPLDRVDDQLNGRKIDLAVNVHSFSECSLSAIDWWVRRAAGWGVRYFLIVPNATDTAGEQLLTNRREPFEPVLSRLGFRRIVLEPKFQELELQKYGLYPTHYHLFRRTE